MDTHKNARLTSKGREQMVRCVVVAGLSCAAAARNPEDQQSPTPRTWALVASRPLMASSGGQASAGSGKTRYTLMLSPGVAGTIAANGSGLQMSIFIALACAFQTIVITKSKLS
jgi:hypothetical protein